MARAKDPDIILCYFKTKTQNSLIKKLQSRGIKGLRDKYRIRAKRKVGKKNIDGKWNQSYIKEQWEELLTSLDTQFKKYFFQNPKDIGAGDLQRKLIDSKIT
ncbi:hypothetical protein CBS147317_4332 [Penicillium roqueforti]|nr:hypothetical protein CBS147372_7673 [Penicillium roqueforti]KAI3160253.1 hypothetical protein CBS147317_4332 [Penicillium roqueforti]